MVARSRVRKVRRHREAGALMIEQTRDVGQVAALLERAGMPAGGVDHRGNCLLLACVGNDPVGAAVLETRIDIAFLRALVVSASTRRRGIGTALLAAARTAVHTRGARRLYALASPDAGAFLERNGFAPTAVAPALAALAGTFVTDYLGALPAPTTDCAAWLLDISRDGLVIR